jgi:catechol 2,3-dioxygenase-like lactoylglutathione lyase family enzyme
MFLGLRTIIYPAPDLAAATASWSAITGVEPYFDEPFYVGFNIGGYELGLQPDADVAAGPITYWGVDDIDAALSHVISAGCTYRDGPDEVGDDIQVATVTTADGAVLGLIRNPHFRLPAS